jgi:hypothetical protein
MSNSVTEWLEQLGLGHYAEAFTENAIDEHILSDLTDADLKELGVTALGHRKTFPLPSLTGVRGFASTSRTPRHFAP